MTVSFTPTQQLAIRAEIPRRGAAPIAEAVAYVNSYVDDVAVTAGVGEDPRARWWIADRLRLFIAIEAQRWYIAAGLNDPPALSEFRVPLFAEFVSLARNPRTFGPGHLVAWFWLLHRALFAPAIDELLSNVRPALAGAVVNMSGKPGAFDGGTDWDSFFDE